MGVYTHQLHANTLYINKIQKTLLSRPEKSLPKNGNFYAT